LKVNIAVILVNDLITPFLSDVELSHITSVPTWVTRVR